MSRASGERPLSCRWPTVSDLSVNPSDVVMTVWSLLGLTIEMAFVPV